MKNKVIKRLIAAAFAFVALAGVVVFAASYGTSSDPLVTLSYLTEIFRPSVMTDVQGQISAAENDLTAAFNNKLSGAGMSDSGFEVLTLTGGQTLKGDVGTQILLRLNSAVCSAASTPGLVDTTTAGSINSGSALTANHLYLVTIQGNGIKAGSSGATILVSGSYTLE